MSASESDKKLMRKMLVIGSIVLSGIILMAAVIILFISARLQQGVLTKQPEYTAKEYYNQAVAQADKGQYQASEQYLEQALLQEDAATYRSQLAVVKYRLKKYSESIDLYQKLIAGGADAAFAWNGIGNAYRDWADEDGAHKTEYQKNAEDAYGKAIALNSGYVAAYSNLALLYESESRKDDALRVLNQGIQATASKELQQVKTTIFGQ